MLERMEHVGEAIRFFRKQQSMTQEELARLAGIAPTSIVRLERGEVRAPRLSTLERLARALAINPAELVQYVAVINAPTPPAEPPHTGPFTAVYQQDEGWWIGYVEELPGANAQERTLEEARESLLEAVAGILEANRELTRTEFEGREVVREPLNV